MAKYINVCTSHRDLTTGISGNGKSVSLVALLAIPGFALVVLCLSWLAFFFGIVCTRYRDLPQIVASVLQVGFYFTPIIWMPVLLPERLGANLLNWNPFYHMLEVMRTLLCWVTYLQRQAGLSSEQSRLWVGY